MLSGEQRQEGRAAKQKTHQFEYGKGKLDCEFCLVSSAPGFVQYTILRLPDVIGPWDNIASHLRVQETLKAERLWREVKAVWSHQPGGGW